MAQTAAEARQEVGLARRGVESELDELGSATRRALDIPAKVRNNPVRTVGLAGGAAFLILGGPKRVAKAAEARLFPKRVERVPTLLPKDVEASVNRLEPGHRERVRGHLERDFNSYLRKEHPEEPANARRSIWRTYDLVAGVVAGAAGRELVKKLFEVPKERKVEPIEGDADAVANAEAKIAKAD